MDWAWFGIACGFLGAAAHPLNFAVTKSCLENYRLGGLKLLIASHVCSGTIALLLFIIFDMWQYLCRDMLWYVGWMMPSYFAGIMLLTFAVKISDASVVSPLTTIKVPLIGAICYALYDQSFSPIQILCMLTILGLGFYFSSLSGKIKLGPLLMMMVCAPFMCWSDLATTATMRYLERDFGISMRGEQVMIALCYEYVVCLMVCLPLMLFKVYDLKPINIWQTKWVSATQLTSMGLIFCCFILAGVTEGNIIQSLRSVFGVIIAYLFFRKFIKDEGIFKKKLTVAVVMFITVTIFYLF